MDIALIRRRTRPADGDYGLECWLIAFYPTDSAVPVLAVTDHPGDIVYGGVTYTAYDCAIHPPGVATDAALPEAELTINDVLRALQPLLAANDWLRGYRVEAVPYNDREPTADYSGDVKILQAIKHRTEMPRGCTFTLGVPGKIIATVPPDTYGAFDCRLDFRLSAGVYGSLCGYAARRIVAVTIPGGPAYGRLAVEVTSHGFVTGDLVELSGAAGISPSLDDVFVVEKFSDDVFKLNGTDGSDYTGSYTGGGLAGHWYCPQHRLGCLARQRLTSFGGQPGMRPDGLRVAT
jgi:hypothetical protein